MNALNHKHKQDTAWRSALIGCLSISIFVITACSLLYWLPQHYNNQQLQQFATHLYNYPLPPHSEVVSQHAEVGLMGNGNHCDFLVRQTIVTELSQAEIEAYYDGVTLPPVNDHNQGVSPKYRGLPIPVMMKFDESTSSDGRLRFTLTLLDYGHDPGLDIRCH